jgi:hypothetical protein
LHRNARPGSARHHRQHDRAQGDVETVEAGEHEEGGAIHAGAHREAELGVGVVVFVGLETQEDHPQQHREDEPQVELGAPPFISPQWAQVSVTPELSSSAVLMAGMPQAPIGVKLAPLGPALGQAAVKSYSVKAGSMPASAGTEMWRQ